MEAEEVGGDSSMRYHLCLTVVPMGDLNGVDIAQHTHESILENHGCLVPGTVIRYGKELPQGLVWEGVYVDDHLVLGVVRKHDAKRASGEDVDFIHRSWGAYKVRRDTQWLYFIYIFSKRGRHLRQWQYFKHRPAWLQDGGSYYLRKHQQFTST